jgi:hypothetical protein
LPGSGGSASWRQFASAGSARWQAHELTGDLYALSARAGLRDYPGEGERDDAAALLVRSAEDGKAFAVLTRCAASLNGAPLLTGMALLRDRDELSFPGGARFYYVERSTAAVERYAGGACAARCVRCSRPFAVGDDVVRCPSCGSMMHCVVDLDCYRYGVCPTCEAPPALDDQDAWSPEAL